MFSEKFAYAIFLYLFCGVASVLSQGEQIILFHLKTCVMKKFLFTAVMASLPVLHCAADRLVYAYDQRGNRISRILEVPNRMSAPGTASLFATESLSGKTLRIYPNPTEGALKVEIAGWDDSDRCTIIIYDMAGAEIWSSETTEAVTDIDITPSPDGMYVMLIVLNGEKTTWKIIKK